VVLDKLSNEVTFAVDGTGLREQTARLRLPSEAGVKAWGVADHHLPERYRARRKTGLGFDADVPSPAQFNHLITYLPHGPIWLGPTPEVAPFGLLELAIDHQARVIPASGPPASCFRPTAMMKSCCGPRAMSLRPPVVRAGADSCGRHGLRRRREGTWMLTTRGPFQTPALFVQL